MRSQVLPVWSVFSGLAVPVGLALLAACSELPPGHVPDAGIDAPGPGITIDPWSRLPDTVVVGRDGCRTPDGVLRGTAGPFVIDDCLECQCTTYGLGCRRRAGCARDVCVFVDGTVVARGETAVVATCFDCACDADGGRCTRRAEAPCPSAGCLVPRRDDIIVELAPGEEGFVSECHRCVCDADLGLLCRNVCHPECICGDDLAFSGCEVLCDGPCSRHTGGAELVIPDQARAIRGSTSCVCDYAALACGPP